MLRGRVVVAARRAKAVAGTCTGTANVRLRSHGRMSSAVSLSVAPCSSWPSSFEGEWKDADQSTVANFRNKRDRPIDDWHNGDTFLNSPLLLRSLKHTQVSISPIACEPRVHQFSASLSHGSTPLLEAHVSRSKGTLRSGSLQVVWWRSCSRGMVSDRTSSSRSSSGYGGSEKEEGSRTASTCCNASASVSDNEFHSLADETLHDLQEKLEMYGDDVDVADSFDVDYSSGVLTVALGKHGTYVINKQVPNRQLWLSSPVSGPARFDWDKTMGKWLYKRTMTELTSLLEKEFSQLLKENIILSSS